MDKKKKKEDKEREEEEGERGGGGERERSVARRYEEFWNTLQMIETRRDIELQKSLQLVDSFGGDSLEEEDSDGSKNAKDAERKTKKQNCGDSAGRAEEAEEELYSPSSSLEEIPFVEEQSQAGLEAKREETQLAKETEHEKNSRARGGGVRTPQAVVLQGDDQSEQQTRAFAFPHSCPRPSDVSSLLSPLLSLFLLALSSLRSSSAGHPSRSAVCS